MKHDPSLRNPRSGEAAPSGMPPFLGLSFALQSSLPLPLDGPRVVSASSPGVSVTYARTERGELHLMLLGKGAPLIELAGLLPERHYHTGHPAQPFLRTDRDGRALLRVPLHGRTVLAIKPVV